MGIITKVKAYYCQNKVDKFTNDLCYHMISIYNYLHSNNTTVQTGDLVKEGISMVETWERVSKNLFKHKESGVSIEIKKEVTLKEATKIILEIEIDNLAKSLPTCDQSDMKARAMEILERYFSERKID